MAGLALPAVSERSAVPPGLASAASPVDESAPGAAPESAPAPAKNPAPWTAVVPGLLRSPGRPDAPTAYALVAGGRAVLFDCPEGTDLAGLRSAVGGDFRIERCLLTHHHRDTAGGAAALRAAGIAVHGPKAEAEFLLPDAVAAYWVKNIPVPGSRLGYLVLPAGIEGVMCDQADGSRHDLPGWTVVAVATPGHTRGHLAYRLLRAGEPFPGPAGAVLPDKGGILISGDAVHSPGKVWSPYTTDWDHWTDAGLDPAARTLRRLADLAPSHLCPAHGAVMAEGPVFSVPAALLRTAERVAEAGFLKSFERFTKHRLGNAPDYKLLVPRETVVGLGGKTTRFTPVGAHLFIHDNTWVLTAGSGRGLLMDLYGRDTPARLEQLIREQGIAGLDAMLVSHAHYDHYLGIHDWNRGRDPPLPVWGLDVVADAVAEPLRYYAPFLEKRPVPYARKVSDGGVIRWEEYELKFHHLPGQTHFTQGVEVVVDGRRCLFTADNWYHHDHYSGSGGWMSLNRASPAGYAEGARRVLRIKPDWILAEHGGPFEFNAEDFRRRVQWGDAAAMALDAISPTGDHRVDWDIHRAGVEPLLTGLPAGADKTTVHLRLTNPTTVAERTTCRLLGRGLAEADAVTTDLAPGATVRQAWTVRFPKPLPPGRHVFAVTVESPRGLEPADAFFVVDAGGAGSN